MAADVAVVIVNWNGAAVLPACIDSVLRQRYDGRVSIVVVDNASTDASRELLRSYGDAIRVVAAQENLGFGRGNNLAFTYVRTPLCVFLNPDTEWLQADGLARLVATLEDRSIGLAGPRLLRPDGTTQQSCARLPSIGGMLLLGVGAHRLLPDGLRRRWAPVAWSHDRSTDTGWLAGACLAMRSADYALVGGFSEDTFMYGEDLDLGYRVAKHGLRVRYRHDVRVLHRGDHSSKQRWTAAETGARVAQGEVVFLRNRYGRRSARCAQLLLFATYAARSAVLSRLGRRQRGRLYAAMAEAVRSAGS